MLRRFLLTLFITLLMTSCSMIATSGAEITGLALFHDRRQGSVLFTDEGIEIEADIERNKHKDLRADTHINVTSYNRVALLTGEAKTEQLRNKVVSLVRVISGVKLVHNEITIGPETSFSSRSNDSFITTKVKTALSEIDHIPGFDATRVKVITENRAVYLMGLVHRTEGIHCGYRKNPASQRRKKSGSGI